MHVSIIRDDEPLTELGPAGWVLCLGLNEKQVIFFCQTDNYPEVVKFQYDFTRQTGFKVRKHPLNAATHNEIVRIWNPVKS